MRTAPEPLLRSIRGNVSHTWYTLAAGLCEAEYTDPNHWIDTPDRDTLTAKRGSRLLDVYSRSESVAARPQGATSTILGLLKETVMTEISEDRDIQHAFAELLTALCWANCADQLRVGLPCAAGAEPMTANSACIQASTRFLDALGNRIERGWEPEQQCAFYRASKTAR